MWCVEEEGGTPGNRRDVSARLPEVEYAVKVQADYKYSGTGLAGLVHGGCSAPGWRGLPRVTEGAAGCSRPWSAPLPAGLKG